MRSGVATRAECLPGGQVPTKDAAAGGLRRSSEYVVLLLRDHGVLTVHFTGMPPGTSALLFKFVPPETLRRLGGAPVLARAVDDSLDRLAALVGSADAVRTLLFGSP
jgi:L-seryl-tRNA(Ser) seleniumtransferase